MNTETIHPSASRPSVCRPAGRPLLVAQERFWVLEQLHLGSAVQNIALGLRWTGRFDPGALQSAMDELIQRHEMLRTEFHVFDGSARQVVSSSAKVVIGSNDLRGMPDADREREFRRSAGEERKKSFDLSQAPLLRATLFHMSDAEQILLAVTHRIVCDESSLRILLSELYSAYAVLQESPGQTHTSKPDGGFAPLDVVSPADISFWLKHLAGAPAGLELPTDHARPAVQQFRGSCDEMTLQAQLVTRLRELGDSHKATLFTTLLAGFSVFLSRYARQEDLVIGTLVSGRDRAELTNAVGPIENMLGLRFDVPGFDLSGFGRSSSPSFADFVARVRRSTEECFEHKNVPFESVVRELRLPRDMSRHPVFQVMFTAKEEYAALAPGTSLLEVENSAEQLDLRVEFMEQNGEVKLRFHYDADLFDAANIRRMMGNFNVLLQSVAADPTLPISRIPLLTGAERQQLLVDWNDTSRAYPTEVPLHRLIEEQVEKTPESIALIYESEQLTYRQLNDRANRLAHYLRENGVGPDVLVGICAERSLEIVIALLASLKAGGAYVPLDPEYPKDRLVAMLRNANPAVVLTQRHLLDRLPDKTKNVFCLDRDWPSLASKSSKNPNIAVEGKSLAYAIYTSGSTGEPKGVPNIHEAIVNRLLWMQDTYQLTAKDRVLQKTPFSFDVSVWEFFWPLLAGATLVVARPGGHRDPAYLVNLIAAQDITTLHFVPSMLRIFLESAGLERCCSIRQIFASGEALAFELQQRFFKRMKAELHNLYGPTEAAVDVTYWRCRPDTEGAIVPIGRPIANTQIYILDPNLQPVPVGVQGELHIGGIGLARGYLNRPDLTAEKFIPDPFSGAPNARLYKTGDLARFLADGNIEYLARIDNQVKLRGFRIELGEIEAVLGQCAGVLQAVVIVREDNRGDKRLVAYLMAAPGGKLVMDALRRELKNKLPDYMVPSQIVVLKEFPMTTSGKVDRRALPAPQDDGRTTTARVAPRNEMESHLAQIFASVLGLPSVGVTDNFFDLGGHSLTAARLLAQINEITGRQIPLSAMFRGATVESLARIISEHKDANDPVVMEIQHGDGSGLPFFAIVPAGEESIGYAILARHMGPQQHVYKVQGHSPVAGDHPYTPEQLQSLAGEYVAAMRAVQPEGPYCVGGLCGGVHIGERVVVELEAQGQEVALFVSIDTWVMQHSMRLWLGRVHYFEQRLREVKNWSFREQLRHYKGAAGNLMRRLTGKAPARTEWQEAYWPGNFVTTQFRAPVILFKRPKQPYYYVKDPLMGWGARTTSGVEVHEINFDHLYLLREPHVRVLGEKLAACIQRASVRNGQERQAREGSRSEQPVWAGGKAE